MNREPCHILLVCATLMELRASIRLLPGAVSLEPDGTQAESAGGWAADSPAPLPAVHLPGLSLHLLVCGVGPVAAAFNLGLALASRSGPPLCGVVNLGLAGTYDAQTAPVGSLVLASEECLPEYGVWPEPGELLEERAGAAPVSAGVPQPMTFPQMEICGLPVYERLRLEPDNALGNMGLACHTADSPGTMRTGTSLTVAGVSGTPGRARRMAGLFGGLTENMEGFALALGAHKAGLPFVELRAVSNEAGERPPHTWDMQAALSSLAFAGRALFVS